MLWRGVRERCRYRLALVRSGLKFPSLSCSCFNRLPCQVCGCAPHGRCFKDFFFPAPVFSTGLRFAATEPAALRATAQRRRPRWTCVLRLPCVFHCKNVLRLATSGILCGCAMQGCAAIEHCKDIRLLGIAYLVVGLGTAEIA